MSNNTSLRERTHPKDTYIIYHIWWAAKGQVPRGFWCAEMNSEVQDYNPKKQLIKSAEEKGLPWQVIRVHRRGSKKGQISIIQKSNK